QRFHVGRGLFRAAFSRGNRGDAEDPFDFRSSKSLAQSGGVSRQFQTVGGERRDYGMRTFPTQEALVAAYWRKLASSIKGAYKDRGRALGRRAARALQTRQGRSRGNGAGKGIPARHATH